MPRSLPRVCIRAFPLLLALLLTLTGCTIDAAQQPAASPAPTTAAAAPTAVAPSPSAAASSQRPTAAATSTAEATASPAPTTPAATPKPSPTARRGAAGTPAATDDAAIKAVIQRADEEQQQAFAAQDPTIMRDTATADYYDELVQTNEDLAASGVTAIALVRLEWGPIAKSSPTQATATAFETWRTTYSDGSTDQSRDRNVYTLVLESGAWKVRADEHPDTPDAPPSVINPGGDSGGAGASPRPAAPLDPSQSSNWAGYAATGGKFTAVSGTWTVPEVNVDGGNGAEATWVGIGGEQSHDLIQAGTESTVASGRVRYNAWIELLPQYSQPVPLVVNPGNRITVSITLQADGTWLIAFENQTTGKSYQENKTYSSSFSSAEWVEEAPTVGRRIVPVDDFGTVRFEGATAVEDGKQVTIAQAGGKKITLIDRNGRPLATTSALGDDGASFSVQRAPVSPVTPAPTRPGGQLVPNAGTAWARPASAGTWTVPIGSPEHWRNHAGDRPRAEMAGMVE